MDGKIDKARKVIALWATDADRLKELSQTTGRTQVELLHDAILALAQHVHDQKEQPHAR